VTVLLAFFTRLRATLFQTQTRRLEEEVEQHAEMLQEEYLRRGMTETQALDAARRELGNLTLLQQDYREQNGFPLLENFFYDLKFALRTLRRNPAFTAACTGTLAIGLGSMIAVLAIVSTLLWKPLPYPNSERLVALREADPRNGSWPFSEPDFVDVQERSAALSAVAAFRPGVLALTGSGEPEMIQAAAVTPSAFAMFGIRPIAGRLFQATTRQVVISPAIWRRKWNMNPAAVGQALALDGENYTIAGVANLPEDLLPGAQMLIPLLPHATESRSAHEIEAVGRLRDGVGITQAQAELNIVAASISQKSPQTNAGWSLRAVPLSAFLTGSKGRVIWMIFAAVALFWLLACVNVAGLQMARNIARGHEMSTRLALGASRLRLFAQALTEGLVLTLAGSLLGVLFAQAVIDSIRQFAGASWPRLADLHLDSLTIAAALGCISLSTVLFTLFSGRPPRLQSGREISTRDGGRDTLVAVQVALASILLLGASLLLHSFLRLRAVDLGFEPEKILTIRVNPPARASSDPRRVAFFRDAAQRLTRLPEIQSAGASNVTPFSGQGTANRFRLDGESTSAGFRSAGWRAVTPGFFSVLNLPLKAGRLFTDADANGSLEVVILSESMARQFWPDRDPIGQRLLWGKSGNPKTIVGIVGDLRDLAVDAAPLPMMYRPFFQLSDAPMTMLLRTRGEPSAAISSVRRELWALDRNTALEFRPLGQVMSDSLLGRHASLTAVAVFAAIAMLTAAFGLYGLISYRVNQRKQEIGVRLALGAPTGAVRWDVQKRCLILVCSGLAVGLPLAYALSSFIASLLYETDPGNPTAYVAVLVLFAVVALSASFGPARRASRLDPVAALRHE
jgi:putative ABC transport system permease protein